VDHDAPAGKTGLLKVHDVILEIDGQPFDNVDQLRRRLRDMPSGRTINLLISRDGNPVTITVQLCDRAVLEQQAWSQHYSVPEPPRAAPSGGGQSSFLGSKAPAAVGFFDIALPKGLYVGAELNPVQKQLADYFGVRSGTGLLVESVDYQSPAGRAGRCWRTSSAWSPSAPATPSRCSRSPTAMSHSAKASSAAPTYRSFRRCLRRARRHSGLKT